MMSRVYIGLLLLMPFGMAAAQPAASKSAGGAQRSAPKRVALFFGSERNMGGNSKSALLPKAADVEALGEKLSARQRNVDPFGLSTYPRDEDQPILDDDMLRATPKITLNQALQTLKINGVNLQHKQFLIGGRHACEGDVIELAYKSEIFRAQVVEVGAAEIQFRDVDRQESGVLKHSVIPLLQIEPLQDVASRFESRMTPMEPTTPSQK